MLAFLYYFTFENKVAIAITWILIQDIMTNVN